MAYRSCANGEEIERLLGGLNGFGHVAQRQVVVSASGDQRRQVPKELLGVIVLILAEQEQMYWFSLGGNYGYNP